MVRTQVQLTQGQAAVLRSVASREGISQAEVIRRALDSIAQTGPPTPDREQIKRRAIAAIGSAHADVTDLSTRHDDYLAEIYSG